jgi:hypothetical protein
MGLVDGEQRELDLREPVEAARRGEPFRRDVEQVQLARREALLDGTRFVHALRRIEECSTHAHLLERRHLVLHQRDQRRHDHGRARPQQRRHLVAQRLAAAGGHQDERVAAGHHVLDDLALGAAEDRVAEGFVENAEGRCVGCHGPADGDGRHIVAIEEIGDASFRD